MGSRTETISIDRLKPAHMDLEQPVDTFQPSRRGRPRKTSLQTTANSKPLTFDRKPSKIRNTRSGRIIITPDRFISVLGGAV